MFKKLLTGRKLFGLVLVDPEEQHEREEEIIKQARDNHSIDLRMEIANLDRIKALENQIEKLKVENEAINKGPSPIDADLADPEPKDTEQRKLYVAQVAGLHKDILRQKLLKMISAAHVLLEEASNPHDVDQAIKGSIYAFREIIAWGDRMINEHVSNQNNSNNS